MTKNNIEKEMNKIETEIHSTNLPLGSLDLEDLQFALDKSSIVAVTNSKGFITYVNDKFCEISKFHRDELLGKSHNIIKSEQHDKAFFLELWKTISSGKVWKGEIKNKAKDGSYYWVDSTIVPIGKKNGKPENYLAIRNEITTRKELEEANEKLMIQSMFNQRLSALAAMASGIAHELNQPLSGIRIYAETVKQMLHKNNYSVEQLPEIMGKIIKQVDRTAKIIEHMREFSSEKRSDGFDVKRINLKETLDNTLELIEQQLKNHGILLINEVDPSHYVKADMHRIEQIFINLIGNSKDSLDEKYFQDEKFIKIQTKKTKSFLELKISDSGLGIPEEIKNSLFEPFVTSKSPGKGTGLGLSICHGILRDFDATIELVKTNEKGTEFLIKFPQINDE